MIKQIFSNYWITTDGKVYNSRKKLLKPRFIETEKNKNNLTH